MEYNDRDWITRYEELIYNGTVTYITTNLSASEIKKVYGMEHDQD